MDKGSQTAVIFDMDGVLIDTIHIHWDAYNTLLAEYGAHVENEQLSKLVGMSLDEQIPVLNKMFNIAIDQDDFLLRAEIEKKLALGNLVPKEGVVELLNSLSEAGIAIAVGTSSPTVAANSELEKIGIRDKFKCLVGREGVKHHKPDPEVYLSAARLLGVESYDCLVFEDAPNGILAAKRAGMKSIGIKSDYVKDEELDIADLVIGSLKDIDIETIDKLIKGRN